MLVLAKHYPSGFLNSESIGWWRLISHLEEEEGTTVAAGIVNRGKIH